MFVVKSEIIIEASPDKVWRAIIDFENYDLWNSQLAYLGGTVSPNGRLHLRLSPEGGTPYEFKPDIIVWEEPNEFAWVARTGIKGIFDGAHFFELEAMENSFTKVLNYEQYSGLLSPIMQRLPMMKNASIGFRKMNEELREYVENRMAVS